MPGPPPEDETEADKQGRRRWSFPGWRRRLGGDPGPRSLSFRGCFFPEAGESSSEDSGRPTRRRRFWLGRSAPPEYEFKFLRLPREARNRIYSLLLVRDEPMTVLWRPQAGRSLGILRACKVTWREATPILYGRNRLDFSKVEPEAASRFLRRIGPRNAGAVRHIIVDFPGMRFDPETMEWEVRWPMKWDVRWPVKWDDETGFYALRALAPYAAYCLRLDTLVTSEVSIVDVFLDLPQLGYADNVISTVFDASEARLPEIHIQTNRRRADWEFVRYHTRVRGWKVEETEDSDPHGARFSLD